MVREFMLGIAALASPSFQQKAILAIEWAYAKIKAHSYKPAWLNETGAH